jgi:hypothetical protein
VPDDGTGKHDDSQHPWSSEDPDFQPPPPMRSRPTRLRAMPGTSARKNKSKVSKKVKKASPLPVVPPLPQSKSDHLEPRPTIDPIVVGKPCWILHPNHKDDVVAFGKSGTSWKTKGQRLCAHGEQLVHILRTYRKGVPLMILDKERQAFTTMDDAIASPSGSVF